MFLRLATSMVLLLGMLPAGGMAMAADAPAAAPAATAVPAAPAATAATAEAAPAKGEDRKVEVSRATADAAGKMTCRTVKVTGSNLRKRKVCSTPDSQDGAADWIRAQQDRGAMNASAVLNTGQ